MKLVDLNPAILEEKLDKLKGDQMPIWGEMNPADMLKHLLEIAKVSTGKQQVHYVGKEEHLPKMKQILYADKAFPRNFEAPEEVMKLSETGKDDLDGLKRDLLREMRDFLSQPEELVYTNAVFGPLTVRDWKQFHRKHISHHLAQFSLHEY